MHNTSPSFSLGCEGLGLLASNPLQPQRVRNGSAHKEEVMPIDEKSV